jgi:hypothetical protein
MVFSGKKEVRTKSTILRLQNKVSTGGVQGQGDSRKLEIFVTRFRD